MDLEPVRNMLSAAAEGSKDKASLLETRLNNIMNASFDHFD
jgi:hypothetical protein